jgi:hypothetical protein
VQLQLGVLWSLVQSYGGTKRALSELAFSATLLPVCRETRHWGYVCDNTAPKGEHGGDALEEYCDVLERLAVAYEKRDADLTERFGKVSPQDVNILCGDAQVHLGSIPDGAVDLIVTSPPYFGVTDYIKAQRLSIEWFGHDMEALRQLEIGARSKRHRRSSLRQYLDELSAVLVGARRCLRSGGHLVLLIGQSSKRASALQELRNVLVDARFTLSLDMNRRVSSQRRLVPSLKGEHIFVLTR